MIVPNKIISERYLVTRLIGEGGMGCVYEAEHIHIGKKVAVKILNADFSKNSEAIERFHQEAQIAGTIGHLNICEVKDFGMTDEGLPFLVMEYLEGESLADILRKQGALPVGVACGVISQILDALVEVHGKGIVHRDLKPENIFITQVKGHGSVVKILDFGISRVLHEDANRIRLTKTGTTMGTPFYMSPEQAKGKKDVLFMSDLYSCGVILYEMVTGQVPFAGSNYNEVIFNILNNPVPDPRKLMPDLLPSMAEILKRSMAKSPADRYGSAEAFKSDIENVLVELAARSSAEPILSRLPSGTMDTSLVRPVVKPRVKLAIVGGVTAAFLLVMTGILILLWLSHGNEGGKNADSPAPKVSIGSKAATPSAGTGGAFAAPQDSANPQESQEKKPQKIKISLTNAPEHAKINYAGKVIEGTYLEIPAGSGPVVFTLSAEGYEERRIEVVPTADATMDGKLSPLGTGKTVETKPLKKKPKAGTGDAKKKKMKHVWKY